MDQIPSKYVETVVNELSRLPGIGRKTATRLALHLLRRPDEELRHLGQSLIDMAEGVTYCGECHSLSDGPVCTICASPRRDKSIICIVEDLPDQLAIEKTGQYNGVYHLLGGLISPIDGRGPSDLNIAGLPERITETKAREVILALPSTIEGDTTAFYIYKTLKDLSVEVSSIARGVPVGDDLEYTDEITLGRSIQNRTPYQSSLKD